jgi:hypothetical protein
MEQSHKIEISSPFLTKFEKIGEIWIEFEKIKKFNPILAFYLKPLRNGSQLKLVYQK